MIDNGCQPGIDFCKLFVESLKNKDNSEYVGIHNGFSHFLGRIAIHGRSSFTEINTNAIHQLLQHIWSPLRELPCQVEILKEVFHNSGNNEKMKLLFAVFDTQISKLTITSVIENESNWFTQDIITELK